MSDSAHGSGTAPTRQRERHDVIQFGTPDSLPMVALRGAVGGEFTFIVPRFGDACVCCNAETRGRVEKLNPSTDKIHAPSFSVPVCAACRDHAVQSELDVIMRVCGALVGGGLAILAVFKLQEHPGSGFFWGVSLVGGAISALALVSIVLRHHREKRMKGGGHHPGLYCTLEYGTTTLVTSNPRVTDEVLSLNPTAYLKKD